jgi:hypothetical protein
MSLFNKVFGKKGGTGNVSSKDFKDDTKELETKWAKVYSGIDQNEKKKLDLMRKQLGTLFVLTKFRCFFFFFLIIYQTKAQLVLIKILQNPQMREKVKDRLKEAAMVFSNTEQMKQLYLNTNWAESFKIVFFF